jgi:hypothetical protein
MPLMVMEVTDCTKEADGNPTASTGEGSCPSPDEVRYVPKPTGQVAAMGHALKRTYASLGTVYSRCLESLSTKILPPDLSEGGSRKRQRETDLGLLMRLGAWKDPGLTQAEFLRLIRKFVQCNCGLIMTEKRYYGEHPCESKGRNLNSGFSVKLAEDKGRRDRRKANEQGASINSGKTEIVE